MRSFHMTFELLQDINRNGASQIISKTRFRLVRDLVPAMSATNVCAQNPDSLSY